MSRFFVGQRVVLARSLDLSSRAILYGLQGRIVSFEFNPKGSPCSDGSELHIDCDCSVLWEGDCSDSYQHTLQLEPIIDPGATPSEYSFTELMDRLRSGVVEVSE